MYKIAIGWGKNYEVFNNEDRNTPAVTVIGCGGTGGFVADGLARMLPRTKDIVLIDMDTVEEHNLSRQSFLSEDIGRLKSEALAERLARRYKRPIKYSTLPVGSAGLARGLIVGCVDNGLARKAIADTIKDSLWWIDSGNGRNFGQVLIGNSKVDKLRPSFTGPLCFRLPLPSIQQPALLTQVPRQRSCAESVALDEQGPTINQAMAALVLEVVRHILEGTCSWMALYLDLDAGTLAPTMATPEVVSQLTGIKVNKLVEKEAAKPT